MNFIRKKLSPLAMPQQVAYVDSLPKTRSGKIMRRILSKIAAGNTENLGDLRPVAGKRFRYIGFPLRIRRGSGSPIRAGARAR